MSDKALSELPALAAALAELRDLYLRVDESAAANGLRCSVCGQCCDFAARQYVLYATELEVEYLKGLEPAQKEQGILSLIHI